MKKGVIFFHKNISEIYPQRWIDLCINSMLFQSENNFKIYEINYGGTDYSIFSNISHSQEKEFYRHEFSNHAEAMNFIIDQAFLDDCDFVFNTNLDDNYHLDRIKLQMAELTNGADLVSSNMIYWEEQNGNDVLIKFMDLYGMGSLEKNIFGGKNIIAHPAVAYSKKFWQHNRYYPGEIPEEDFLLWKRALSEGFNFSIVNEYLLNYRLHAQQVTGDNSGNFSNHRPANISNKPQGDPTRL